MTPAKIRGLRRRVVMLIDAIEDDYQAGIVRGAAQASEHAHVELVCVAGGVVGDGALDHRSLRNFVFDAVDPKRFDGVLVLSGALGNQVGVDALERWERRFSGVPLVNLGTPVPLCHSISVDGAWGMRDVIAHLIDVHHHRRIAFIRGPATSRDAEDRYTAYRAVLAQRGIAVDPTLVLQGTWLRESGAAAVRELLEVRGVNPKTLQAIACANDYMALGALDALRERGISVPTDLALTGFDDLEATRSVVPPLTTVRQPTEELGREGLGCGIRGGRRAEPRRRRPRRGAGARR